MNKVEKRACAILKGWRIECNCGGPQYGTDHSPDCAVENLKLMALTMLKLMALTMLIGGIGFFLVVLWVVGR